MYVTAIVVAAGRGRRLKSRTPKPLVKVNGRPLVIYCLQTLDRHSGIKDIVVVADSLSRGALVAAIKRYRISKVRSVVPGGRRRQDSVRCGLAALSPRADLVLIHDAARPFVNRRIISETIKAARESGAAIAAVPVKATIKEVVRRSSFVVRGQTFVKKTLDRDKLWEVQTPQVFKKEIILEAYKKFGARPVTDDAALAEKSGAKVRLVTGSYSNIKITTPEDLLIAEAIAKTVST